MIAALSLVMPSNRNLADSRAAIESALVYAQKTDTRLIVSDNSGDPEKSAWLRQQSGRLDHVDSPGASPADNALRALRLVESPFVMPMGDDDEIVLLDDRQPFRFSDLADGVIAVRPTTLTWSLQRGVHANSSFEIEATQADGRIAQYAERAGGSNALYYSAYRSAIYRPLLETFYTLHPTRGGYCDWSLTFALVACGRVVHDPSTVFRYNLGRWSTSSGMKTAAASLYRAAGLPPHSERYRNLLRFIDTHCLLSWAGLPLPARQRARALHVHGQITLDSFARNIAREPATFSPFARCIFGTARPFASMDEAFDTALAVIDEISPGLGPRYRDFLQALQPRQIGPATSWRSKR